MRRMICLLMGGRVGRRRTELGLLNMDGICFVWFGRKMYTPRWLDERAWMYFSDSLSLWGLWFLVLLLFSVSFV